MWSFNNGQISNNQRKHNIDKDCLAMSYADLQITKVFFFLNYKQTKKKQLKLQKLKEADLT